ncbi:MAG: hypothetical protein U1F57_04515 [bacterium]
MTAKALSLFLLLLIAGMSLSCEKLDALLAGASKGTLVASPGMSIEEIRRRSTFPLAKDYRSGNEVFTVLSDSIAFDFELAGTGLKWPRCRFYNLQRYGEAPIHYVQIQVSKNISWAEAKRQLQETGEKLKRDGWTPSVVDGKNAEERLTEALQGPAPGYQVGFLWTKGDISLNFDARRFPYAVNGEKADEGEPYEQELYIQTVEKK